MCPASAIGPPKPVVPNHRKYPTKRASDASIVSGDSNCGALFEIVAIGSSPLCGRLQRSAHSQLLRSLESQSCRGHVLQCHARAVKNRDLVARLATRLLARHNLSQFAKDLAAIDNAGVQ